MFSSRNIHFALLGIILGASAGYVFAFYKAYAANTPPAITQSQAVQGNLPPEHPGVEGVNTDQMLEQMKKAVELDPKDPEIIKRYAMALFDAGRFDDAEQQFGKAVDLEPNSVEARAMFGAALWRLGKQDAAAVQLEATLKLDAGNIPALHGLTLLHLERRNLDKAAEYIKQIESVEPSYSQLALLKSRLEAERAK
jgi:Tfp pilus assembly protein PilF